MTYYAVCTKCGHYEWSENRLSEHCPKCPYMRAVFEPDCTTPARIAALIQPGQPARLEHPICGRVDWLERAPGEGFMLVWAEGPEKGRPLSVDETVLFDDRWTVVEGEGPIGETP